MRNIKVFIASSAELDEDKLQMDLYFSICSSFNLAVTLPAVIHNQYPIVAG